jgi:hypothetical protein
MCLTKGRGSAALIQQSGSAPAASGPRDASSRAGRRQLQRWMRRVRTSPAVLRISYRPCALLSSSRVRTVARILTSARTASAFSVQFTSEFCSSRRVRFAARGVSSRTYVLHSAGKCAPPSRPAARILLPALCTAICSLARPLAFPVSPCSWGSCPIRTHRRAQIGLRQRVGRGRLSSIQRAGRVGVGRRPNSWNHRRGRPIRRLASSDVAPSSRVPRACHHRAPHSAMLHGKHAS